VAGPARVPHRAASGPPDLESARWIHFSENLSFLPKFSALKFQISNLQFFHDFAPHDLAFSSFNFGSGSAALGTVRPTFRKITSSVAKPLAS